MIDEQGAEDLMQSGEANLSLLSVEVEAIRHLTDAIVALRAAALASNHGYIQDHCETAMQAIRKAMRSAGA